MEVCMTEAQKVPRRDEVPVEYTWDLTKIYADTQAWERDLARLEGMLPEVAALQGTIGAGADGLLRALNLRDEVFNILYSLYVYASQLNHSDTTNPSSQALDERANSQVARISAALAFIEPEILAVPQETITAWLDQEPKLKIYTHEFEELARQREHIRSAEVEGLLAEYGDITRAPNDIFDILTNADLQFPTIQDERDQPIQLSHARYGRLMEHPDRRVRRDAFKNYYSSYKTIQNTLCTTLAAEVRSHTLNAPARSHKSAPEGALQPRDIPLDVYHNLIATVNANLPRVHRYMGLRQRMMGLEDLRVYDLYAPLVPQADVAVPYGEAAETVQAAFAPLGAEYAEAIG